MEEKQLGVQSIRRVFLLIDLLSDHPSGISLQELSQTANMHKSTVHRLLQALIYEGYVVGRDGKYSLTLKMLEIGSRMTEGLDIQVLARPILERLRDTVQETVHLVVQDGCDIVYIQKLECRTCNYRMASHVGMRRPAYCTGAGKSILSTLTYAELQQVWERTDVVQYTGATIIELQALYAELQASRMRGYALDNEENEPGMRCIAAPVYDVFEQSRYAISISAPLMHMSDERISELAPIICKAANEISALLGYTGVRK